jgi:hypothetical protein
MTRFKAPVAPEGVRNKPISSAGLRRVFGAGIDFGQCLADSPLAVGANLVGADRAGRSTDFLRADLTRKASAVRLSLKEGKSIG